MSDYCGLHPELRMLEDLDALIAAAGARDLHVVALRWNDFKAAHPVATTVVMRFGRFAN